MPLTLDELKSLIAALGVRIPDTVIDQKAKAEEFDARREKIVAEAAAKPADWRLKADFDDTVKRAVESAGQQQFEPALKLLDESEQILQQPDVAPAPVVEPPPVPQPETANVEANAVVEDQGFLEKWTTAKQVWLGSLETVDRQLDKVRAQMLASGDPDFKIIADLGLPALTDGHKTPVMKALFELDGGTGASRRDAALKAEAAISSFRNHLNSFNLIRALDEHSMGAFGVPLTLRSEVGKGLTALEQAIQTLIAS